MSESSYRNEKDINFCNEVTSSSLNLLENQHNIQNVTSHYPACKV